MYAVARRKGEKSKVGGCVLKDRQLFFSPWILSSKTVASPQKLESGASNGKWDVWRSQCEIWRAVTIVPMLKYYENWGYRRGYLTSPEVSGSPRHPRWWRPWSKGMWFYRRLISKTVFTIINIFIHSLQSSDRVLRYSSSWFSSLEVNLLIHDDAWYVHNRARN